MCAGTTCSFARSSAYMQSLSVQVENGKCPLTSCLSSQEHSAVEIDSSVKCDLNSEVFSLNHIC
jgi:hypothetical protein